METKNSNQPSLKYSELRQQSQLKKDQQEAQFEAQEAKLQLQADILATQQSIAKKKKELAQEKAKFPFNPSAIVQLQVDIESLEEGEKRLRALDAELFD